MVVAMHLGQSLGKHNTLTMQHWQNIGETFPHGGSATVTVCVSEKGERETERERERAISLGGLSRAVQPLLRC